MTQGWRAVTLGDVIVEARDKRRVEPGAEYPLAGVFGFGRGMLLREPVLGSDISAQFLYRIRAGQLVYSRLKAFEGAFALVSEEADGRYVSNEFPTFDVDSTVASPQYLALCLARPRVWEELESGSEGMGARRERLQPGDFLLLELELPPLEQQERIVDVVSLARRDQVALQSQADVRHSLYLALLDELVDGDDLPLVDIVQGIEAGLSPRCLPRPPREDEWGVLSTAAVRHGIFRVGEAKALPPDTVPKESVRVQAGDLLTIRASGTKRLVGGHCIVPTHRGKLLMSDYHWRVSLLPTVDPRFLMHATAAPDVRARIDDAVVGSTSAGKVSQERYLAVEVPVPDLGAQRDIATKLDVAFDNVHAYFRAAECAGRVARGLVEEFVTGEREAPALGLAA